MVSNSSHVASCKFRTDTNVLQAQSERKHTIIVFLFIIVKVGLNENCPDSGKILHPKKMTAKNKTKAGILSVQFKDVLVRFLCVHVNETKHKLLYFG